MLRQLVGLIFRLLGWLIVKLFPIALRLLGVLGSLMLISLTSAFVGVPKAIERISETWITQATNAGLPVGYHPRLRQGATAVAGFVLVLGWLITLSLVIFLIRVLAF